MASNCCVCAGAGAGRALGSRSLGSRSPSSQFTRLSVSIPPAPLICASLSVRQPAAVSLTEYDHMSAARLACQRAETDRRPGNLPSSWGRATDSSGPAGPRLMSHTVDTLSTPTRSLTESTHSPSPLFYYFTGRIAE